MDWVVIVIAGFAPHLSVCFSEQGEGSVSGLCHVGFPLFGIQGMNYLQ